MPDRLLLLAEQLPAFPLSVARTPSWREETATPPRTSWADDTQRHSRGGTTSPLFEDDSRSLCWLARHLIMVQARENVLMWREPKYGQARGVERQSAAVPLA